MHHYTKIKIRDIRKYLKQNFKDYTKKYDGVVGMHVTKKTKDEKQINRYALVVRVKEKKSENKLHHIIPKYIQIPSSVPKVKVHNVPTDVVPVGEIKFNSVLTETDFGRQVYRGTVSTIFYMEESVFMLSCMHVFGGEYIEINRGGPTVFDKPEFEEPNIYFDDYRIGTLKKGVFLPEEGVDIAMAQVNPADALEFQDVRPLQYDQIADYNYLEKANLEGFIVSTDGAINQFESMIIDHDTPTRLRFNNKYDVDFDCVIALYGNLSENGDSGGLVYDEFNMLYGIILGSDNSFTYVVNLFNAIEYL